MTLLEWVSSGDDVAAMVELYRRHGPSVYADACRLGGHDAAEMLTTDAFLAVWQQTRHGGGAETSDVRAWLREVLDVGVDELVRAGLGVPEPRQHSDPLDLLASLPEAEARVLSLVVLGTCTYRETAALTGSSESTVRRAAERALRRLRRTAAAPEHAGLPRQQTR